MSSSTQRASHTVGWAAAPLGSPTAEWETAAFAQAEPLSISNFTWRTPGPETEHPDFPHPQVQVRAVWDDAYLGIMFRVEDHYVQCVGCAALAGPSHHPTPPPLMPPVALHSCTGAGMPVTHAPLALH